MKLKMDPLLQHMTAYFDELLCELDSRFKELDKENKATVLLSYFRLRGAARPTKPAFGRRTWKATETVTDIIGRIARRLQPCPAPDEGPLSSLTIATLPNKDIWADFIDGAEWTVDEALEGCLGWLRAELILMKKPEVSVFWKRHLLLQRELRKSAKHMRALLPNPDDGEWVRSHCKSVCMESVAQEESQVTADLKSSPTQPQEEVSSGETVETGSAPSQAWLTNFSGRTH